MYRSSLITHGYYINYIKGEEFIKRDSWYGLLDLLGVTCGTEILLMKNMRKRSPVESIESQHGCPTLTAFNTMDVPSLMLVSDNDGPIDVFDMQRKLLVRSYLEHISRVTGLSWYNGHSFVSSSADGTVRFYKTTD